MKSRILALLLALLMVFSLLPLSALAEPALIDSCTVDGFRFLYYEGDLLRIEGLGQFSNQYGSTDVTRMTRTAKTVEFGSGITSIAGLFDSASAVETVKLPGTLITIGSYCFASCAHLKSIEIPDSVRTVQAGAFDSCTALETVKLSKNMDGIFDYCFNGCSALSAIYPTEQLRYIGVDAFNGCVSLEHLDISGVERLGQGAFCGCECLSLLKLGDKLDYVGRDAVSGTPIAGETENGLLYLGNALVSADKAVKAADVRPGTVSITAYCFAGCGELTEVKLPDGLRSIGDNAFAGSGMESIDIPDSVDTIGANAFGGCGFRSIRLPASLKALNRTTFFNCTELESIVIPEGVTYVDLSAFEGCTGLISVMLPGTLEELASPLMVMDGVDYYFGGTQSDWNGVANPDQHRKLTSVIKFHEHQFIAYECIIPGSCTESGLDCGICVDCGSTAIREVPATGHKYVDRVCIHCGKPAPNPFKDVADGAVYCDAVLWAYYAEPQITSGFTATEFKPQDPCTRGQVVTFLWRAAGCPEPMLMGCPFEDVSSSSPYYKAILWAADTGITTGYDETHFRPNATVTRAQFVTFLWRFENKPASTGSYEGFTDGFLIAPPYRDAVAWAVEKGITTGYGDGSFRPNATCTRWAVVLFMYRDLGNRD